MAAPWMLLGRVLRVAPGPEDAAAAAAADDDFSIPVALPPQITVVTANPNAHPDPKYPDRYPYVLAANPIGVLVNLSSEPFYGVQLSVLHPLEPHLVLLHEFHDPMEAEAEAEVGQAMLTATAERLPPREGFLPIICNLESIGIGKGPITVTREEGMVVKTIVSELMVDTRSETARIAYWYYPDGNAWLQQERNYPLAAYDRHWVPSGVLLHDERLWWFDLSWGILSCEVSPEENGKLLFHPLPQGRALDESRPGIHDHRCIAASGDALRYVEILINEEGDEEAMVAMWTATPVLDDDGKPGLAWEMAYSVRFAEIWNDDSYVGTGLPRRVPVITAVCPWNPDLVYFTLEQERRLFGVDVPQHRVVEFVDEAYDLVMPWPAPPSSRYVLAWLVKQQDDDAEATEPEEDSEDDVATEDSSESEEDSADDVATEDSFV